MVRREGGGRGISLCCRQQIIKLKLGATRRRLAAHENFKLLLILPGNCSLANCQVCFVYCEGNCKCLAEPWLWNTQLINGQLQHWWGRGMICEYALLDNMGNYRDCLYLCRSSSGQFVLTNRRTPLATETGDNCRPTCSCCGLLLAKWKLPKEPKQSLF